MDTQKAIDFRSGPMKDKPVGKIPGVGRVAARKLGSMGYTMAENIYNKLKSFNFDENKFRVWITMICTGVNASTIYEALMMWYYQFEDQQNDEDSESTREGGAGTGLMGRAGKVQFDVPETECDNNSPVNDARRSDNPLEIFFSLILHLCNTILPEFHTEFQTAIFNVVRQFQKRSRKIQIEDIPSTSYATGGGA